jgi:hypothetical protein
MNRKSSLRTAAASAAAVLETNATKDLFERGRRIVMEASSQHMNAPEHAGSSPAIKKPVEVDLASPSAAAYWSDPTVELFARLEELYPGDPGQLSGVDLRIAQSGPYAWLAAQIGAGTQPDGAPAIHCFGHLKADEVARFAEEAFMGAGFVTSLHELYPYVRPDAFSGAALIFFGGDEPKIQLCFGAHCLGVLRGPLLTAFLECARLRSAGFDGTEVE